MARKLPDNPTLPKTGNLSTSQAILQYLNILVRVLQEMLSQVNYRLNRSVPLDGTDAMTGPFVVKSYTVATVPTAASYTRGIIWVSDETGGATLAFSDGTNWRRVQDYAIVS